MCWVHKEQPFLEANKFDYFGNEEKDFAKFAGFFVNYIFANYSRTNFGKKLFKMLFKCCNYWYLYIELTLNERNASYCAGDFSRSSRTILFSLQTLNVCTEYHLYWYLFFTYIKTIHEIVCQLANCCSIYLCKISYLKNDEEYFSEKCSAMKRIFYFAMNAFKNREFTFWIKKMTYILCFPFLLIMFIMFIIMFC